jgi:hypothetical protein
VEKRAAMITLRAFTVEDGWAIVQDGDVWWLTKGAYRPEYRQAITEGEAAKIVVHETMDPADESFPDWDTMASALTARRIHAAGPNAATEIQVAAQRLLQRGST